MVLGTLDVSPARPAFLDARRGSRVALSGKVLRAGAPLPGALVTGLGSTDAITGADGAYSFREPLAARVVLHSVVTPPEPDGVALRFETGCMTLGKEEIRRDFDVPTGSAELRLVGRDGRPVAGVLVTLSADASGFTSLEGGSAVRRTDAEGVARWIGLPAGAYGAVVRFPGGVVARRGLVVEHGGRALAEVAEPAGAPFDVHVREPAGGAATGATVVVRFLARADDPGSDDPTRFAKAVEVASEPTGPEGRTRFASLADGVLLVSARRGPLEEAPPQVVSVGPKGEPRVVLDLRREAR
jgi:hypothetical protein